MTLAEQLQRRHLADLVPYASARRSMSGGNIWLNANESPYNNEYQLDATQLNRYPAFQSNELNQAYAGYAGVAAEQVMSCRGSDEAIELLIRAFCEPGQDNIVICPPTYGMYAISAQTHGAAVTEIPLRTNDWQLDLENVIAAAQDAKLVFLCSPSNPLGNRLNPRDLQRVLSDCPDTLVVVDEAYIEFCADASTAGWLSDYPNLVVLRTLSKAFALAGARCGFALANQDIIEVLKKVLAPYPLPDLTVQVATQALNSTGLQRLSQQVNDLLSERKRLRFALDSLPMQLIADSDTNFLLYATDEPESLIAALAADGILIRNQSAQRCLPSCVRISIGSQAQNDALIEAITTYFDVQAGVKK